MVAAQTATVEAELPGREGFPVTAMMVVKHINSD